MSGRIVVIGGGPGGATTAALLASRGHLVTVLEKTRFPRFHLGESLLPQTLRVLGELGLMEAMHERFLVKNGAQFFDDSDPKQTKHARFGFDGAIDATFPHAFQVPRDEFDQLLLRRAAALGADVREEWSVEGALRANDASGTSGTSGTNGRIIGVTARDPKGELHAIAADLVVDASGRDALFARGAQATRKIDGLDGTSLYAHWTGIPRDQGDRSGDIRIVLFSGGWTWVIPFKDGRTSIGVVLSRDGMRARAREIGGLDVQQLYIDTLNEAPATRAMLAAPSAKQGWTAQAAADFSYRVTKLHGAGWISVGDAAGFIDPLFSTGVHLAMQSASFAADAIDAASKAGELSGDGDADADARLATRLDAYEARVRGGAELFVTAVRAFYEGRLVPYLFASSPRTFLRRAITSMLAGDVFDDDARWKRDMKTRFDKLNAMPPDSLT